MAKLQLSLNGTKHVYNPKYRTFHITLQHLYGEHAPIDKLHQMGDIPIELRNRETGNTVLFEWVGRESLCNLYRALYAHDILSPAIEYKLIVWDHTKTFRAAYSADSDIYDWQIKSPELVTSSTFPPIPAL